MLVSFVIFPENVHRLEKGFYYIIVNSCPFSCFKNISVWKRNVYQVLELTTHFQKHPRLQFYETLLLTPRAKQGSWKLSKHKLLPKRLPPWLFVLRTSFRSSLRTTYRLLYIREKHWQNGKTFIAASSRLVCFQLWEADSLSSIYTTGTERVRTSTVE